MTRESRSALKEWAVVDRLLGSGRIAVLARKGGIHERRGDFQVEHRDFWIFPTHFHQNPAELSPRFADDMERQRALPPPSPDEVRLRHFAEVVDAFRVEDEGSAHLADELHPLTPDAIDSRFRYRGRPYLHLLLLRVHRLPEPVTIPNTLDYEGCVSWVELDDPVATGGAAPVLGDDLFAELRGDLLGRLEGAPGVTRL